MICFHLFYNVNLRCDCTSELGEYVKNNKTQGLYFVSVDNVARILCTFYCATLMQLSSQLTHQTDHIFPEIMFSFSTLAFVVSHCYFAWRYAEAIQIIKKYVVQPEVFNSIESLLHTNNSYLALVFAYSSFALYFLDHVAYNSLYKLRNMFCTHALFACLVGPASSFILMKLVSKMYFVAGMVFSLVFFLVVDALHNLSVVLLPTPIVAFFWVSVLHFVSSPPRRKSSLVKQEEAPRKNSHDQMKNVFWKLPKVLAYDANAIRETSIERRGSKASSDTSSE